MARSQQMFTQPGQMYAPDTQRRMALAQALRTQGLQTPQGTSMGSGTMQRFAAPHWSQYVANLAQGLSGAYMEHKAEQTNQDRMSEFVQALRGTDSPQYVMEPGYEQPSQMDRLAALEDNPFAQQALMNLSTQSAAPQYRTLSAEEAAQMGLPEGVWQMSPEGQIEPAYEAESATGTAPSLVQEYEFARQNGFTGDYMDYVNAKSADSAPSYVQEYQFFSNLTPEQQSQYLNMKRAGKVVNLGGTQAVLDPTDPRRVAAELPVTPKPEQTPEYRAQVVAAEQEARGEIPESEKTQGFKEQVTGNLQTMANAYKQLAEMGAAVDVQNSTLENIVSSVRSSTVGQAIERRIGTDAQSLRNQINALKPALINNIRQASNMGARGLDSEKELEFYLRMATDETRDIQSNIAAIEVLDKAYGLGMGIKGVDEYRIQQLREEYSETGEQTGVPEGVDPQDWQYMTDEEKALFQ